MHHRVDFYSEWLSATSIWITLKFCFRFTENFRNEKKMYVLRPRKGHAGERLVEKLKTPVNLLRALPLWKFSMYLKRKSFNPVTCARLVLFWDLQVVLCCIVQLPDGPLIGSTFFKIMYPRRFLLSKKWHNKNLEGYRLSCKLLCCHR